MSLGPRLLEFVRRDLASGTDLTNIDEDTQLLEAGIIDSVALFRLITFIEENAGVRVPDDEVLPDNFQTVRMMEALVERLRTSKV